MTPNFSGNDECIFRFSLSPDLKDRFDAACARARTSKASVLRDYVAAFVARVEPGVEGRCVTREDLWVACVEVGIKLEQRTALARALGFER